ncbi:MAG: deoxyribose-phosphate aldolase [Clostridiales bacterium]|nr:deoxyribose-phosphate aldolase [Clostridiales bacterium]
MCKDILSICDHTLLKQDCTWEQIKQLCDEGIKYKTASVCIPPHFVKKAKAYVGDKLAICTVIGFPNGYNTTSVKVFETEQAIKDGADEIDMVINICEVKNKNFDYVLNEINQIKQACKDKILKVIIETCLLTKQEIVEMCMVVSSSNADYIKTSTGFSTYGATFKDVELMKKNIRPNLKLKAAGGISSFEDATKFISLGANRLGTSKIVKLVKEKDGK